MNDIYPQLTEPFPREMEKILNKGGTALTYIPVSEVITRLNKVLGVDKWSFKIVRCERDASDPDFVVAHVRLEWIPALGEDFNIVTRDGFGGQKIKRTKQGQIVDLGDEFKGAISDALKKAAQTLGVGLYLARSEDAIEIEQVIDASNAPLSEHEQRWEDFKDASKKLTKDERDSLGEYWKQEYGDKPKPTSAKDATQEILDFLYTKLAQIKLKGEVVEPGK
jgi:hypothetical protein